MSAKALFTGSFQVLLLRISWAVIGLVGQIIIARTVGVSDYGHYSLIFAWLAVLALPGRLGFDEAAVKFVATYHEKKQSLALRGFSRFAFRYTLLASLGLVVIALLVLPYTVQDGNLLQAWKVAIWCLPLLCLIAVRQGILRGLGELIRSQLGDTTVRPLLLIAFVLFAHFALGLTVTLSMLMAMALAALLLAYVLGELWLRKAYKQHVDTIADSECEPLLSKAHWLSTAAWMALLSSSILIMNRTDILMLGAMTSPVEVGLYAVASKLSIVFTFGLAAVNTAIAPLISRAHTRGDRTTITDLMRKATLISLAISLALLFAVWLAGDYFLGVFGAEFIAAKTTFYILIISHLASALVGPTGPLLNMTGHHKHLAVLFALVSVLNVVLNYYLIPLHGIEGAAAATLISALLLKVLSVLSVRHYLQMNSGVLAFFGGKP